MFYTKKMTPIENEINKLWIRAENIQFFGEVSKKFDTPRIMSRIYFLLQHVFDKNNGADDDFDTK